MTTATPPRPTTLPRPTALPEALAVAPAQRRKATVRAWSPYDAPVHQGSASTRADQIVYAATLVVSYPASIVASIAGACGLAVGTPVVLAWQQRH